MSTKRDTRKQWFLSWLVLFAAMLPTVAWSGSYTVNIVPITGSAMEGSPLKYRVELVGAWDPADTSVEVTGSITDISATTVVDYTSPLSGTITLNGATPSVEVEIPTLPDTLIEGDETFKIALAPPTMNGAVGSTASLGTNEQTATINDDTLQVSVLANATPASISETAGTQTFTIQLSRASTSALTVGYTTGGTAVTPSDYTLSPTSSLEIPAGSLEGTVTLTPVNDSVVELPETAILTLTSLTTTDYAAIVASQNTATAEITSDDVFEVSVLGVTPASVYEDILPAENPRIRVELSNPVSWPVTIGYTFSGVATNNVDFIAAPLSEITIPAGNIYGEIIIDPTDDTVVEPDEAYTLTLTTLSPITSGALATNISASGTILNDDYIITVYSYPVSSGDKIVSTDPSVSVPPDPSGTQKVVRRQSTPTFNVTADTCNHIKDVKIDGSSVGAINSDPDVNTHTTYTYTFPPITGDRAIKAEFELNRYKITTNILNPDNGTVTAGSTVDCNSGPHEIIAKANDGYLITWFKVNGVAQALTLPKNEYTYTANNVMANVEIEVAFTNKVKLTHISPPNSPYGTVASVPANTAGTIDVDYGTALVQFTITGEDHSIEGPGAIPQTATLVGTQCKNSSGTVLTPWTVDKYCNYLDANGKPIYSTSDARTHTHHLSSIRDNNNVVQGLCQNAGGLYTETDYSQNANCRYELNNITQDHEVEILFTSFLDLRTKGPGSILNGAQVLVDGNPVSTDSGFLEVPAKSTTTLSFLPITNWYTQNVEVKAEKVDIDRRTATLDNLPALVSLGGQTSYTFTDLLDQDWGVQATFKVNELTLRATSTFEKTLFTDSGLTTLITKKDNNELKVVEVTKDASFYVVINDLDYAVVGLNIDNNFLTIKKIREYAATPANNPENATYKFIITTVSSKERLEVKFTNVIVSHNLEVRDYDSVVLSDLPLDAQTTPNPPAIMFLLDDSGSMDWEVMMKRATINDDGRYKGRDNNFYTYIYNYPFPTIYPGNNNYRVIGASTTVRREWESRFSGTNTMYYKPTVAYTPWPTFSGTITINGTEIASKLPPTSGSDNKAHVDIYRPPYHPWLNTCTAADKSTCPNAAITDNFDLDGTYDDLGVIDSRTFDENEITSSTGTWDSYSNSVCLNDDYRYNTGAGTATWTFVPLTTGVHSISTSWVANNTRSTDVLYTITCATCSPSISTSVQKNQQQTQAYDNGTGANGLTSLGDYTFQIGKPVTVKVQRNNATGSLSIDALKFTWQSDKLSKIINAHYYTWDDANNNKEYDSNTEDIWLVNLTNPITYSKVLDKTAVITSTNLGNPLVASSAGIPKRSDGSAQLMVFADYTKTTSTQAFTLERQNFADWFSYYRSRSFTAVAGISLAIEKMSNVQVGIKSINYSSTYGISQSALPVNVWGERDKTKYLYYLLYNFRSQPYGTPLRSGFQNVGKYFDATDGNTGGVKDTVKQSGVSTTGNDDLSPFVKPATGERNGDRCKDAFTIVVTDGYWNGDSGYDATYNSLVSYNDLAPSHLRKIYQNSLADTAYQYYASKDLMQEDLPNNDRQNMITYGVAFGVTGDLAFDKSCTFTDSTGCPTWNTPKTDTKSAVDDLWHASVNGGGEFLSADSPDSLVEALSGIIKSIRDLTGSSASLAASGDELYVALNDEVRMYQPSWNSATWTGDLKAYEVNAETGDVKTTPLWSASSTLSKRTDARVIATYKPDTSLDKNARGTPFNIGANDLTDDQKSLLFPYFAPTRSADDVIKFIRGDGTISAFRDRDLDNDGKNDLLGDIVNSQGAYMDYYDAGGNSLGGIIYIGANDGMLHAFSAKDSELGKELFAYVPNLVMPNLRSLADPEYKADTHKMFVDGSPRVETIKYTSGGSTIKKTLLIGGLGKGGKGYYCLDVTDARSIDTEDKLAARVLWEFPPPAATILSKVSATFTTDTIVLAVALTDDQKAKIETSKFITIFGTNYSSGVLNSTNDGTYEVDTISADKKSITITRPLFAATTNVVVSVTESISDHDMGYSFSKPTIVKSNDKNIGTAGGWVVIFGNGYGSDNGNANLYIIDPLTGEEISDASGKIGKIQTAAGPFNGLSNPKAIDKNNDLKADYAYAGDLLGNMWKFDLLNGSAINWQIAFCEKGDATNHCQRDVINMIPKPLFSTSAKQPITGTPDVMRHQTDVGYMVIFGTGKFLGWIDLINTDLQSLYGIWDWAPDALDTGYLGARADNIVNGTKFVELTNWPQKNALGAPTNSLLLQTVLFEEADIQEDLNNDGVLTVKEDIDGDGVNDKFYPASYYRIPTSYPGDWSLADNDKVVPPLPNIGGLTFKVPTANMGWVFDLTGMIENGVHTEGERMINDAIIRDGKAIMISFGLSGDKCGSSAYSFLNERSANNGGMLFFPVYDLNGDNVINREDSLYFDSTDDSKDTTMYPSDQKISGRASNPIIGERVDENGNRIEDKYMSSSAIEAAGGFGGAAIEHVVESPERKGVYYWRQVE